MAMKLGAQDARGGKVEAWTRLVRAVAVMASVIVLGTVGYVIIGLSFFDALYQSVTTVTTVGFREVPDDPSTTFRLFTIVLLLGGVGGALYALGVLIESFIEGAISERFGRRRMERELAAQHDHVIVCGWGRVGRAIAGALTAEGSPAIVVVDRDPERAASVSGLVVHGDATDEGVLREAGVERCRALVAALHTDADNVYVTLAARRLRPDLFIVARARVEAAEALLTQAGANRVVNPQAIGGARMAALVAQPHVADFLDVAMHDAGLEFRLTELEVSARSEIVGKSLRDAHLRDATGALVLAVRMSDGAFRTNPDPSSVLNAGEVLIAIGTETQLKALRDLVEDAR